MISEVVTLEPVNEIILVGTKVTEVKEEIEEKSIDYETVYEEDPNLEKSEERVKQAGKAGVTVITYEVKYVNGKETDRKVISEEVTKEPVNEII